MSLRTHPRRRRPHDARAGRQHLRAARPERRRQDDDAEDADEPAPADERRGARPRRRLPRARPGRSRPHRVRVREPADPVEPDDRRDRGVLPAVVSDLGRRARHRAARALRSRSARPHQVAVARHAPQGAVPARARAAAAPADPRRAVQRPRSGRARRPDHRRPQPRRSRRLERAADVARDGRRRAPRRSRRLPRQRRAARRGADADAARALSACRSRARRRRRGAGSATVVVARVLGRRPRRALRRVAGLARRGGRAGAMAFPAPPSTRGRCRCARCSWRSRVPARRPPLEPADERDDRHRTGPPPAREPLASHPLRSAAVPDARAADARARAGPRRARRVVGAPLADRHGPGHSAARSAASRCRWSTPCCGSRPA